MDITNYIVVPMTMKEYKPILPDKAIIFFLVCFPFFARKD